MEKETNRYGKIRKKDDETYIIEFNGMPFQVTPNYPPATLYGEEMTHEAIAAYIAEHPEEVEPYETEKEAALEEAVE